MPELRPLRMESVNGLPKRTSHFQRGCEQCGASFVQVEGGDTHRGIWDAWGWWCSVACYAVRHPDEAAHLVGVADG